jgi:hypothetical protein
MAYSASCHVLLIRVPWFDQSACSFVPTCHSTGIARKPGQIRRPRRDRSHAQPPLGGEHGEDPQFDRAEHNAKLRHRREAQLVGQISRQRQASRVKRSA